MFNLEEVAQLWMIYYQSWKVFAEAGLCGYLMLVLISVCSNHGWCRQVSLSTSLQFRISRWTGDTGQVFINQFSVSAFFLNVKWRKCPVEILQTFCFQWYNEVRCKSYFIHLPTKFYCILIWYLCICLKSSSLLLNIFTCNDCAGLGRGWGVWSACLTGACSLCWMWRWTMSAAEPTHTSSPGMCSLDTGQ